MIGIHIFEKLYYREIRTMRGRPMRGPPVSVFARLRFITTVHMQQV